MSTQTSKSAGWRCASTLVANGNVHSVTLELDRNMGGMWPRVVVELVAQLADKTVVCIAADTMTGDEFDGPSGMTYQRGIATGCVPALLRGAAAGMQTGLGVEMTFDPGGVAIDTAELVCERAAQIATKLVLASLTEPRSLDDVLAECATSWSA